MISQPECVSRGNVAFFMSHVLIQKARLNLTERTVVYSIKLGASTAKRHTFVKIDWFLRQLSKPEANDMYLKAFRTGNAEEPLASLDALMNDASAQDSDTTSVVLSMFGVFYIVGMVRRFAGNKVSVDELAAAVPLKLAG